MRTAICKCAMHAVSRPRALLLACCAAVSLLLAPAARAQTPALDAERSARMADAFSADPLVALAGLYRGARLLELHADAPDARERFLVDVSSRARHALVKDHARWQLALADARAGELERARTAYQALGVVMQAQMLGPFENTGGGAFASALPVASLADSLREPVNGLERPVRWQPVALDPRGGFDLGARMTAVKETRALVAFVVNVKAATAAALRIGSSGQVRALVNGVEVGRDDAERDHALDQSAFGAQLVRGDNLVVLELGFLDASGRATIRLTLPDGAPLKGASTSDDLERIERALATRASTKSAPVVQAPSRAPAERAAMRAAVDIEVYLGAHDQRKKPNVVTSWLETLASDDATPALERSSFLARLGVARQDEDVTRAREHYEQALALDPKNVVAWLQLADIREDQGRLDEARALLARAAAAAPRSDLLAHRRLDFMRRHGETGVVADERVLERAKAAPTERNLGAAAHVLEERGDPVGALALVRRTKDASWAARIEEEVARARAAEQDGAVDDVLRAMRTQLRLRPTNHDLAERLMLALEAAGHSADADALLAERRAMFSQRAEPEDSAAKLALARGDRSAAKAALRLAVEKNPQDADLARTLRALDEQDDMVARYGVSLDELRALPVAPDAARPGAEMLAQTVAIRLFDNGLARVLTDKVVRVVDAKKARALQKLSFDYAEGRETLDVLVAEKWSRRGGREAARRVSDARDRGKVSGVYSDAAAKVVDFGPLEDGDVLFIRTRKELVGRQNLFGDFFGVIEPIQSTLPVRNWRLVIEAPRERPLIWGGRGAPTPTEREQGATRTYDFVVDEAPLVIPEPQMPPFLELARFLSVSTYGSWADMGRWYEAFAAPALVLDDELRAIARRERAAAKDDADVVRRLYEYVVTSTRYVGIELGVHGWKPYPVAEVHRRRYGDCKDKASLLVALLREAGVSANLALVRTANLGSLADAPPSMWTFNHAIAYVPALDLFLDGTAEQSGWRELPTMDQGAQSLIVGAHGVHTESRLVTIPLAPAEANLNVSDYVLSLDANGTLAVRGKERFRGHANAAERRSFADAAMQRDVLQRHLSRSMPGTAVERIDTTDLSLAQEEIGYDFVATLPSRAVRESDGSLSMPLSLYPHDIAGNYADRSSRTTDVYLDHPWRTRNVMRYVLPAGYDVADLPSGGTVDSPFLKFVQRVERTPGGFVVDEDASLLVRRVSAADYEKFRSAALAADALMKRKIRIVKKRGSR